MDEVRVYNRALVPAEIQTDMNSAVGVPDAAVPTVSVTAPVGGATVSGTVSVTANAADNVGVAGVQFKLDGVNLGAEDTTAPYSVSWNTATAGNGPHTLTAVARDAAGNTTTATAVTVTVDNDLTPPTVSLTAPADSDTVAGTVTVTATAADAVGVTGVQFKLNGVNLGAEVTAAPYVVSWDTTTTGNGIHTLTAVARDAAGNTTTATAVTVTVANADTTAPTVSLTTPTNGATVLGTVSVTATATDAGGMAGVQFLLDGSLLGAEDTAAPYSVSWNTATAANGSHTLTAVARDAAGNTAPATPVNVTVNNDVTPPTVSLTAPADNATVAGTVSVTATATAADAVGVAGVQFKLDGANLGAEDTAAPYSVSLEHRDGRQREPHPDGRRPRRRREHDHRDHRDRDRGQRRHPAHGVADRPRRRGDGERVGQPSPPMRPTTSGWPGSSSSSTGSTSGPRTRPPRTPSPGTRRPPPTGRTP